MFWLSSEWLPGKNSEPFFTVGLLEDRRLAFRVSPTSISNRAANTVSAVGAITVRGVNAIAVAITVVAIGSVAVIPPVTIFVRSATNASVAPFTVTGIVTVHEFAALLSQRRILPPMSFFPEQRRPTATINKSVTNSKIRPFIHSSSRFTDS